MPGTDGPPPGAPPRAGLDIYKAHGLGNDYLVVDEGTAWSLTPGLVRRVCHRTRGAGSDGIIWVSAGDAPFRLRGFNPDGSEFERSGNGLRVVASHLHRQGRVGDAPFRVRIGGDEVEMQVLAAHGDDYDVVVDMGTAAVQGEERFDLDGRTLAMVRVSVGNPHAVLWGAPAPWTDRPSDADFETLGAALATHAAFPEGTNVQLARTTGPGELRARVWERGVGPTEASGTSACAVAASAVATGRVAAGELRVVMDGGTFGVTVDEEQGVRLRGPVAGVFAGRLAPGMVRP